jgi:hypothetical protein
LSNWSVIIQSTSLVTGGVARAATFGMQVQQRPARVADDPAGVVGAHDHLQRRGDRLLRHGEDDGRILGLGCCLEHLDGIVHLPAVLVGRAPAPHVRTSADQRQDRVGKIAHVQQRFHGGVMATMSGRWVTPEAESSSS